MGKEGVRGVLVLSRVVYFNHPRLPPRAAAAAAAAAGPNLPRAVFRRLGRDVACCGASVTDGHGGDDFGSAFLARVRHVYAERGGAANARPILCASSTYGAAMLMSSAGRVFAHFDFFMKSVAGFLDIAHT